MINPNAETVELEEAEAIDLSAKYEALTKLVDNKDFQLLVVNGYLKDESVRLTSLLAKHGMEGVRTKIFEALAGVSHFEQYLDTISLLGAPQTEESDEE